MTDINEMLDKQSEKNDEERGAEKWEPEEGDTLDGIILKTGWYDGGEYEPSMFFILKDMDGDTHRAYCPTVLKNQLLELQQAMGTGIAIRYEGRKESKNSSRKYHAYTLVPVPDKNGKVKRDSAYWKEHGVYRGSQAATQDSGSDDESYF